MDTWGGAHSAPTGIVSFLFTDVVGSTPLWEREPTAMRSALERHDELLRRVIADHQGYVFSTGGDAFCVAFHTPGDAARAALAAQYRLHEEQWPDQAAIRVRMGLHVGTAQERGGDYFGTTVNRAARLMGLAQGGQVILSTAMEELLAGDDLPNDVRLRPLGDHELRGMSTTESLFQLSAPGLPTDFAPIASSTATPSNVTSSDADIFGREQDVTALVRTLSEDRLVTIAGPGGIGKTTLATEIASQSLDQFTGGVWILELAPLHDPAALLSTLASVVGAQSAEVSLLESVLEILEVGPTLLLIDNCEHLVDPVADLVQQLLAAPTVTVLATSRVPLHLRDERVWAVEPLAHHGVGSAAVDLFVHHASRARRDFALTEHNAGDIEAICRLLDGMPLAVELAAARCRSMTPTDILVAIERDAGRVLRGARRDVDERQRTLAATIDWSVDLLTAPERELFARSAVFAGSFDLTSAEAVCAGGEVEDIDVIDLLDGLVDQSMVTLVERPGSPATRYRLLEPIRQFANALPAERDDIKARHAQHFVRLAHEGWKGMWSDRESEWIERLDADSPNHRTAYQHCTDHDDLTGALTIAIALNQLGELALQQPFGAELLFRTIELDGVDDHELGPVALAHAAVARSRRQDPGATELSDRAITLARTPLARVETTFWRSGPAMFESNMDEVLHFALRALAISTTEADGWMAVLSRSLAANSYVLFDSLDEADSLLADLPQDSASSIEQAMTSMARSRRALVAGRPKDAFDHAQQAVEVGRRAGNRWSTNTSLLIALSPAVKVLSPTELVDMLVTAMPHWRQANDLARLARSLPYAARALTDLDNHELAAKLSRPAPSHQPPEQDLVRQLETDLTNQLGRAKLEQLQELAHATPLRELADETLEELHRLRLSSPGSSSDADEAASEQ